MAANGNRGEEHRAAGDLDFRHRHVRCDGVPRAWFDVYRTMPVLKRAEEQSEQA
jgi:hypothetical protein